MPTLPQTLEEIWATGISDLGATASPDCTLKELMLTYFAAVAAGGIEIYPYNIVNYGASPLGIVDSTAAVEAAATAANAAGGAPVYVPNGNFLCNAALSNLTNVSFIGTGTLIGNANNTANVLQLTSCTGGDIAGITFNANRGVNSFGTNEDLQCNLHLVSCSGMKIYDGTYLNCWFSGIRLGTFGTGGVSGACSFISITNNYINSGGVGAGGNSPDQGIGVWNSTYCTVTGNVIEQSGWTAIDFCAASYCTATGNSCYNNAYEVGATNAGGHGVAFEGALYCSATANSIDYSNVEGIFFSVDPQSGGAATNCSATANSITRSQNSATGILFLNANSCTASSNTVEGCTGPGIQTESTNVSDCNITGNVCRNNTGIGIWVKASGCSVTNNIAIASGAQGILMQSVSYVEFAGNFSIGSTGGANFDIRGTNACNISGNVAEGGTAQGFIFQDDGSTPNTNDTIANNVSLNNTNEGFILLLGSGHTITGNLSTGNGGSGGLDLRGVQYSTICGNSVINNGTSSSVAGGITLENQSSTYCLYNAVTGNVCTDNRGASAGQSHGINEIGNSNYNNIQGNVCQGNVTSQVSTVGANTVTLGGGNIPSTGAGFISDVTSTGSTITITDPTGPTTNVEVHQSALASYTKVPLVGTTGVLTGSPPAAGAPNFQMQAGVQMITASSGNFSLTFPTAFTSGIICCILTPNNDAGNSDVVDNIAATAANAVTGQFWRAGSALTGSAQVQYIAIGF